MKGVSFVVPVYNEVENVAKLHAEIVAAGEKLGMPYEIIMVDDGSSDGTFGVMKRLGPITVIRMRTNFGQTAAMDAGIKASQYDYIITMDGDLQNDPTDSQALINTLESEDLDVVSGWRKNRIDPFSKKFVSRGANLLRKLLVKDNIHDSGCSLKIYKRECFEDLNLYGEMHRFIPALLKMKGFRIGETVVNHRARTAGKTKYNFTRTMKGLVDMIIIWYWNRYAVRPFHILGSIGIFLFLASFLSGVVTLVQFFHGIDMSETLWPMTTLMLFLIGIQFFILGFISDTLMKTYYGQTGVKAYSVKEKIVNREA
ncbi:MAG: glycosyltransferase family 2 protein [Bacteroidota bacterium]|nr:glycosyltransferase family 2 protein [Bacteroidota bacterium]